MHQPLYNASADDTGSHNDQPIDLCGVMISCPDTQKTSWQLISKLLNEAQANHAHEIHLEPDDDCWRLRFRSPFSFTEQRIDSYASYKGALELLKQNVILSLNPLPTCRAWFGYTINGSEQLVQFDAVSTSRGLTYLLTILQPFKLPPPRLDELAMNNEQKSLIRGQLAADSGLVLVVGDTANARVQTSRALVQEVVSPDKKIVCADAPGHPLLPRTTQLTVSTTASTSQVQTWQAMCQLSCDVVMAATPLGDELSQQLVSLATERTLVIQSLAVNSSAAAVERMISMGVRSEALASTLTTIIVQKKIQCICHYCRQNQVPNDEGTAWLAEHSPINASNINDWLRHRMRSSFSNAPGCVRCNGTGQGRAIDIYDIVTLDDAVIDALYDADIRYALTLLKPRNTLATQLLKLAQEGIISLAEALRVYPLEASNQ